MTEILFDDPTLNWPNELNTVENEPFRRIIERIVARIGGPDVDTIGSHTTSINSNTTSISTLQDTTEELEELIILLQKRTKTTISMLEQKIKCLEEKLETD